MGAYSELDLDRKYEDDPFVEDDPFAEDDRSEERRVGKEC